MEAPETHTHTKTDMVFHPEIHSNLRKYDKIERNKNNRRANKKTTNQSEAKVLAAVYTSHQVWCLQRLSERAVQKTPLTPDKGRKWIPTCGEVELKRPSLIMTNTRWWFHCACIHTHTNTQKTEWEIMHQLNIHKWKQLASTHVKGEQKIPNNAKIGFWKVRITNASKPNSTLTTYPVASTGLQWKLGCQWFSSNLSLFHLLQLVPQSVLKCSLWSVAGGFAQTAVPASAKMTA